MIRKISNDALSNLKDCSEEIHITNGYSVHLEKKINNKLLVQGKRFSTRENSPA